MNLSKPTDVIARDGEWAALTAYYARAGTALTLVLGRRRSGKSYLLTRFAAATGGCTTRPPDRPSASSSSA